ncbi:MAG: hypothetical protein ACREP2_14845 [Rhodanobacteraceae bacterium]
MVGAYGYRYVDKELVTRLKFGGSADWGVHTLGDFGPHDQFQYAVSGITGAGFKEPRIGNSVDVEARLDWLPTRNMVIAVGGYRGKLAQNVDGAVALHTARRQNAMVAFANDRWRVGAQYFRADDWRQVTVPQTDRAHGWSTWASVQVTPKAGLFARHDDTATSVVLDPGQRDGYSNLGVEWRLRKQLRTAALYKRERLTDSKRVLTSDREIGVYAQLAL